ncbi:MAG: hypothetical protein AB1710_02340 [Pseudomonadota bacterium]|jgi:hypothetical protein
MLTPSIEGFVDGNGVTYRYAELQGTDPDAAWVSLQDASIEEYLNQDSMIPAEIQTLYELFDGFIASVLSGKRKQRILDVGCGIRSNWPPYVRSLQIGQAATSNVYVGLDPLKHNMSGRQYPFIAGRLEDLPGTLNARFDAFLFSTSLDHFQDIRQCAAVISSLANPGAVSIFWIGLHDPAIVAEQVGAHVFRKIFASLHPVRFLWRYLEAGFRVPVTYIRLLARRSKLLTGKPLDNLHFHYFTERNLRPALELFGEVERYLQVPGTNSVFVCVRHR